MSKKKEELEALVDKLHDWAVRYGEPYVTMYVSIYDNYSCSSAYIATEAPDYWEMKICKKNETPAAETTGESG